MIVTLKSAFRSAETAESYNPMLVESVVARGQSNNQKTPLMGLDTSLNWTKTGGGTT